MEDSYDRLVRYYLDKLWERYNICADASEIRRMLELLRTADEDTVKKIQDILDLQ